MQYVLLGFFSVDCFNPQDPEAGCVAMDTVTLEVIGMYNHVHVYECVCMYVYVCACVVYMHVHAHIRVHVHYIRTIIQFLA